MSFRDDVEAILPHLPREFTEEDLDRWVPWLRRRHRDLPNPRRHLREVVLEFSAQGVLSEAGSGIWRRPGTGHAGGTLELGLMQGDETDREELGRIIGTDGPTALQRGIFKRADGPFRDQLLLFHDPEENPYGDVVGSEVIHYVGQGQEGDQKLQGFNRYIAEHLKRGLTVHFFIKEDTSGELRYRGEVVCEGVERVYRPEEQRSVLEFKLIPFEPLDLEAASTPLQFYEEAQGEMQAFSGEPRFVDRRARTSVGQRLVRNIAFRDIILDAYAMRCAVCGDPITHGDLTELEAAHIVGVSERGPDEPRNGLSLCGRHHWAFDNGVFTLTDSFEVQSFLVGEDPHGELVDGAEIHVPEAEKRRPHRWYVRYHREKWRPYEHYV